MLINELVQRYKPNNPVEENLAKKIALKLKGTLPVIYTAFNGFEVAGVRWRGQLSENSKILAYSNFLPEMNHNEIVGWSSLNSVGDKVQVIFLHDGEDHIRVKRRMEITSEIISASSGPPPIDVSSEGKSLLARIFSLIYLGDWVSYYLAILNEVDPTPVENIRFLKESLK
jgi:glucose/mannose-6-phosphate isomerase